MNTATVLGELHNLLGWIEIGLTLRTTAASQSGTDLQSIQAKEGLRGARGFFLGVVVEEEIEKQPSQEPGCRSHHGG